MRRGRSRLPEMRGFRRAPQSSSEAKSGCNAALERVPDRVVSASTSVATLLLPMPSSNVMKNAVVFFGRCLRGPGIDSEVGREIDPGHGAIVSPAPDEP